MSKFLNKLISGVLSLTIASAPVKIEASVLSTSIKLIVNAFGLLLSMYIINRLNVHKEVDGEGMKYTCTGMGLFGTNLVLDAFQLKSDSSKDELEKRNERLEMENMILRTTKNGHCKNRIDEVK